MTTARTRTPAKTPLLELDGLSKEFTGPGASRTIAVDDVTLTVAEGETLALVGESGSGKTTLTRLLLGLLDPTAGTVRFDGQDLAGLSPAELRAIRAGMQVVLQDPYSSMNPRMKVTDIVAEPLVTHDAAHRGRRARTRLRERVGELLESVGLSAGLQDRYPHEFSGGQRQRISIARALAPAPRLVVLDEPTSALDVSVQSQVLDLLVELQRQHGLTYVFVSHNLAVVRQIADRVAVLRYGKVVECGETAAVLGAPRHPYTRELLAAVPRPDAYRTRAGTGTGTSGG
ncbi:ATP-binding cassette domain-containing protein [Streptomyces sp. SID8361]|uniref:ATP-binding cassette domain-containing protein n=1 Tax=Streptomyces TaxID=1883 RepID=UPI00081D6527|nr:MULTISPECIES: ATP-binding cassette domain-containing protein [unclassified Streptomyces]AUA08861.1 Oligopeptide transport ATP-binding protein OppF [Streptomyces sp. M56]MYU15482.1 ATP-binding cassette domain-containing protein [Streptomyces sp. SID8361]MYX59147.1 ATP-binding cassette domain-containing protein [Streptomyces sp. SID8382]SCG09600.1 peptide/nickel transport system ATP-binding protein/oligopeptide transport system ATP-binding protein [Streptomyces sp. MnatMP-M27]